jgi:hypothetical protein
LLRFFQATRETRSQEGEERTHRKMASQSSKERPEHPGRREVVAEKIRSRRGPYRLMAFQRNEKSKKTSWRRHTGAETWVGSKGLVLPHLSSCPTSVHVVRCGD